MPALYYRGYGSLFYDKKLQCVQRIMERKIFDLLLCPFEPPAKQTCKFFNQACQLGPRKANAGVQIFFHTCFWLSKKTKIYFFQRHVFPLSFLSLNSRCALFIYLVCPEGFYTSAFLQKTFIFRKTLLQLFVFPELDQKFKDFLLFSYINGTLRKLSFGTHR